MILGEITNCCQSIGGNSEVCVIDGITRENQGFYILIKTKRPIANPSEINWDEFEEAGNAILGQGYIWRSKENNLVFDSWENKGKEDDLKIANALPVLAEKIIELDTSVSRVLIGMGGKTPKALISKGQARVSELIMEGSQYYDSTAQVEIAISPKLKKTREKFKQTLSLDDNQTARIVSVEQAKKLKAFPSLKSLQEAFYYGFIIYNLSVDEIVKLVELEKQGTRNVLCSSHLLNLYSLRYTTLNDLLGLSEDKINLLTCNNVIEGYKTGKVTAADLKDLDYDRVWALVGYRNNSVRELYITTNLRASDLIGDTEKAIYINMLKTISTHICNDSNELEVPDDIPYEKIEALSSYQALCSYRTGKLTIAYLNDLDVDKVKALASYEALPLYETCNIRASDLISDTASTININILKAISKHICKDPNELEIVDDVSDEKFKELTTYHAKEAYKEGKISMAELIDLDAETIHQLCFHIIASDLDVPKIKALTPIVKVDAYKRGKVCIQELKDLDIAKLQELTSSEEAMQSYIDDLEKEKNAIKQMNLEAEQREKLAKENAEFNKIKEARDKQNEEDKQKLEYEKNARARLVVAISKSILFSFCFELCVLYYLRTNTNYPKDITSTAEFLILPTLIGLAVGYFCTKPKGGRIRGL